MLARGERIKRNGVADLLGVELEEGVHKRRKREDTLLLLL